MAALPALPSSHFGAGGTASSVGSAGSGLPAVAGSPGPRPLTFKYDLRDLISESEKHSRGLSYDVHVEDRDLRIPTLADVASNTATPRRAYKAEDASAVWTLLMEMNLDDPGNLEALHDKFHRGLKLDQFIRVICDFLPSSTEMGVPEDNMRAALAELFAEIDVNSTGQVSWEEFSTHLIESGGVLRSRYHPDRIKPYTYSARNSKSTTQYHAYMEKIKYFPGLGRLAAIEADKVVRLYEPEGSGGAGVEIAKYNSVVLDVEHSAKHHILVTSTADLKVSILNCDANYYHSTSWVNAEPQLSLRCHDRSDTLFTGSLSGPISLFPMGSWNHANVSVWSGHSDMVMDLLSLPTEDSLISCSMDSNIIVWDMALGRMRKVLSDHTKGVLSLTFAPDYNCMLSAGFEHDAIMWNPYAGTVLQRLVGHTCSLVGVHAVPGTPQVITADIDGCFKVWDIRTGGCVQTLINENGYLGKLSSFAYCQQQSRIVGAEHRLHFYDYLELDDPLLADSNPVRAVIFNDVSNTVLTTAGCDARIWDARTGSLVNVFKNVSKSEVTAVCLDARKRRFIVGDHTGAIRVFNYSNGSYMRDLAPHEAEVSALIYCDDYKNVISSSWDRTIRVHEEFQGGTTIVKTLVGHESDISCCAFSPHVLLIASGSSDGNIRFWSFETGLLCASLEQGGSEINAVTFADPYPIALSSDTSGHIFLWNVRYPNDIQSLMRLENYYFGSKTAAVTSLVFAPHALKLFTGDDKGEIKAWNMALVLERGQFKAKAKRTNRASRATRSGQDQQQQQQQQQQGQQQGQGQQGQQQQGQQQQKQTLQQRKQQGQEAHDGLQGRPSTTDSVADAARVQIQNRASLVEPYDVKLLAKWRGHREAVASLFLMPSEACLFSAGFDMRVMGWDHGGTLAGSLAQANYRTIKHGVTWNAELMGTAFEAADHNWQTKIQAAHRRRAYMTSKMEKSPRELEREREKERKVIEALEMHRQQRQAEADQQEQNHKARLLEQSLGSLNSTVDMDEIDAKARDLVRMEEQKQKEAADGDKDGEWWTPSKEVARAGRLQEERLNRQRDSVGSRGKHGLLLEEILSGRSSGVVKPGTAAPAIDAPGSPLQGSTIGKTTSAIRSILKAAGAGSVEDAANISLPRMNSVSEVVRSFEQDVEEHKKASARKKVKFPDIGAGGGA